MNPFKLRLNRDYFMLQLVVLVVIITYFNISKEDQTVKCIHKIITRERGKVKLEKVLAKFEKSSSINLKNLKAENFFHYFAKEASDFF